MSPPPPSQGPPLAHPSHIPQNPWTTKAMDPQGDTDHPQMTRGPPPKTPGPSMSLILQTPTSPQKSILGSPKLSPSLPKTLKISSWIPKTPGPTLKTHRPPSKDPWTHAKDSHPPKTNISPKNPTFVLQDPDWVLNPPVGSQIPKRPLSKTPGIPQRPLESPKDPWTPPKTPGPPQRSLEPLKDLWTPPKTPGTPQRPPSTPSHQRPTLGSPKILPRPQLGSEPTRWVPKTPRNPSKTPGPPQTPKFAPFAANPAMLG